MEHILDGDFENLHDSKNFKPNADCYDELSKPISGSITKKIVIKTLSKPAVAEGKKPSTTVSQATIETSMPELLTPKPGHLKLSQSQMKSFHNSLPSKESS